VATFSYSLPARDYLELRPHMTMAFAVKPAEAAVARTVFLSSWNATAPATQAGTQFARILSATIIGLALIDSRTGRIVHYRALQNADSPFILNDDPVPLR